MLQNFKSVTIVILELKYVILLNINFRNGSHVVFASVYKMKGMIKHVFFLDKMQEAGFSEDAYHLYISGPTILLCVKSFCHGYCNLMMQTLCRIIMYLHYIVSLSSISGSLLRLILSIIGLTCSCIKVSWVQQMK